MLSNFYIFLDGMESINIGLAWQAGDDGGERESVWNTNQRKIWKGGGEKKKKNEGIIV